MLDVEIPLLFILSIMLSIVFASRNQQSTNHFLIVFYHIFLSEEKNLFIRIQGISSLFSYNLQGFVAIHTLSDIVMNKERSVSQNRAGCDNFGVVRARW